MHCSQLEWDPAISAEPHAAYAGVLAGLVFAGIVVLVSERGWQPLRAKSRLRALMILAAALCCFAFDAFIFSIIAGEQLCAKSWRMTMPAEGLLGVGALGVFAGLSWLFDAYEKEDLTRISNVIAFIVTIVAAIFSYVDALSYRLYMEELELIPSNTWFATAVHGIAPVGLLVVVVVWILRSIRARRLRTGRSAVDDSVLDRRTRFASYFMIGCVAIAIPVSGSFTGLTREQYEPVTSLPVPGAAVAASLLPLVAIIFVFNALPLTRTAGKHSLDPVSGDQPDNVLAQFEMLSKLRDASVLTSEEFDEKARELLARMHGASTSAEPPRVDGGRPAGVPALTPEAMPGDQPTPA